MGQGQVKLVDAKVEIIIIIKYPTPTTRKELMRFLGMAGYYRKFCRNFASVCEPLTNLLKKGSVFEWSITCQKAFETIKSLLVSAPVLATPNFDKLLILTVDVGVGTVLLQKDCNGVDHPIGYFSKVVRRRLWHWFMHFNILTFTSTLLNILYKFTRTTTRWCFSIKCGPIINACGNGV